MAEKQDVVRDVPEVSTESAQPAEGVEGTTAQPSPESSPSTQPSDMAWVGGVKKDARKKGYDEGYAKAQEELRQALLQSEKDSGAPTQNAPTPSQANVTPMGSTPAAGVSPEMVQAAAQNAQMDTRFRQIAQMGTIKYPDYAEKIGTYIKLAQEKEASQDPDFSMLMTMAANFGNEDLVYKVASDENFRNEILQTNPKLWSSKLLQSNMTSPTSPHLGGNPTIKVAAPPTGNLPKASSYGDLGEMSSAEKRLRQKRLQRG